MKITLKDIGVMQEAEFELGDLTIICGKNNTGKTYATYALYGFLHGWNDLHSMEDDHYFHRYHSYYHRYYLDDNIQKIFFNLESFKQLEKNGKCEIDIKDCLENMQRYIAVFCKEYSEKLSKIFASSEKYFEDSSFVASRGEQEIDFIKNLDFSIMDEIGFFSILKKRGNTKIEFSLDNNFEFKEFKKETEEDDNDFQSYYAAIIDYSIAKKILFSISPKPFIISAERTGVAIYRNELNFARNKLLSEMSSIKDDEDLGKIYRETYQDYALPIKENVNFTERFKAIAKHDSFIAKEHSEILDEFSKIIEGKFTISDNDLLYYLPEYGNRPLTMAECSSGVRASLILSFYLHHQAKKGDLLIIDEPELNLHPENQRRMTRLFARLVNIGVKVFITTHSDYITSEFSNLILLNSKDERIIKIAEKNNYKKEELISHEQVKLYTAEPIKANSKKYTLNRAKIDAESGIDAEIFNDTIDKMNDIRDELFFG